MKTIEQFVTDENGNSQLSPEWIRSRCHLVEYLYKVAKKRNKIRPCAPFQNGSFPVNDIYASVSIRDAKPVQGIIAVIETRFSTHSRFYEYGTKEWETITQQIFAYKLLCKLNVATVEMKSLISDFEREKNKDWFEMYQKRSNNFQHDMYCLLAEGVNVIVSARSDGTPYYDIVFPYYEVAF